MKSMFRLFKNENCPCSGGDGASRTDLNSDCALHTNANPECGEKDFAEKKETVECAKSVGAKKQTLFACMFIAVFVFSVFAIFQAVYGIYPFGKKTMSSYDMLAQVAPFIEHFFDVFNGKSSLFYTFAIAGGADVFGTLAFCCLSPFTFVFLLFGEGSAFYATSIVLPLKIVCVGISALIYLRKRFKNLNVFLQIALALSYAFCGYLFVSNTYISWVDLLIYLPFVAWGEYKIVNGGKKTTFVVALCLMIYTCFSITSFSMFIIYPVLILYAVLAVDKSKRGKVVTDTVLALLTAVMFSLPILISSLAAFMVSGRRGGLFSNLLNDPKADPLYYKISYIFTDALTLFFTVAYFVKNGVKRPIARFLLLSGVLVMFPVLCDECCLLLNAGSYNSYALRFGFLNGFYFLFTASLYLNEASEGGAVSLRAENGALNCAEKPFGFKENAVFTPAFAKLFKSLCLALGCVVFYLLTYYLFKISQTEWLSKYFSSRFAHSLGGLEITVIMFALVAIIALSVTFLVKRGKISALCASVTLLAVVCGQSAFYGAHMVNGNASDVEKFKQIGVLTDYAKTLDGNDYARIKTKSEYLTADMPFSLHTNSFTVFSSVIDARNFVPTTFFGYGGNGNNTMKSHYGTFLGDCLLGYKYLIATDNYPPTDYKKIDGSDTIKCSDQVFSAGDRAGFTYPDGEYSSGKVQAVSGGLLIVEPVERKTVTLAAAELVAADGEIESGAFVSVISGDYAGSTGKIGYYSKTTGNANVSIQTFSVAAEKADKLKDSGEYKIYESMYAFPNAFKVGNYEYAGENADLSDSYREILTMLGGELKETSASDITVSKCEGGNYAAGTFKVHLKNRYKGYYFMVADFENPEKILYVRSSYNEGNLKKLGTDGCVKLNEFSSSYNSVYFVTNDETAFDCDSVKAAVKIYYFTDSDVRNLSEKAQYNVAELNLSAGKITADVNAFGGENLFLNYVALPGHKIVVNGKKAEFKENRLGFMVVPLEEGENHVEITYSSPYVKLFLIGVLIAAVYAAAYYFLAIRTQFIQEKTGKIIRVAAYALAGAVVLFFFAAPLFICLYKLAGMGIKSIFG